MNRNAAVTIDQNLWHARSVFWSSEWSFVEDIDVVLHKAARPTITEKQMLVSHAVSPNSSQSGVYFI